MKKYLLLLCLLPYGISCVWTQTDTVAGISTERYGKMQLAAEQKWQGDFKKTYEEELLRWTKPYVILFRYTNGNSEEYGYLNFGNGKGRWELSEMEYHVLRKYIK